jgi:ribonuclease HII
MALWAGIDEAGYGPRLGPLVVGGATFAVGGDPAGRTLWDLLGDAVSRTARGADGRLVVNDSKRVYSPAAGLKRLEEGVLAFLVASSGQPVSRASDLFGMLGAEAAGEPCPWFRRAADLPLPVASNESAVRSKAAVLRQAMARCEVALVSARASAVFAPEFNRVVAHTRNKSLLLFQKCGLLLQDVWERAGRGRSFVLVDKHGSRKRYRRLLRDVFPHCRCDVMEEAQGRSSYRVTGEDRALVVVFQEGGDAHALPTALASMVAKYVRELHMLAFNAYWQQRLEDLKPTAGYSRDARRFLRDIAPALHADGVDESRLVRSC